MQLETHADFSTAGLQQDPKKSIGIIEYHEYEIPLFKNQLQEECAVLIMKKVAES